VESDSAQNLADGVPGIRYTIRAGIERGQYRVVIHPDGVEVPTNRTFGSPQDAEVYARRMILSGSNKSLAKNRAFVFLNGKAHLLPARYKLA